MILNGVLYDRESKAGPAGFFRMAFVYTIETLKDAALMFGRNTNVASAFLYCLNTCA
jgi:hypothetical protein